MHYRSFEGFIIKTSKPPLSKQLRLESCLRRIRASWFNTPVDFYDQSPFSRLNSLRHLFPCLGYVCQIEQIYSKDFEDDQNLVVRVLCRLNVNRLPFRNENLIKHSNSFREMRDL